MTGFQILPPDIDVIGGIARREILLQLWEIGRKRRLIAEHPLIAGEILTRVLDGVSDARESALGVCSRNVISVCNYRARSRKFFIEIQRGIVPSGLSEQIAINALASRKLP